MSSGYDGFIAEFYDHVQPYSTREDLEYYVNLAGQSEGPVLELGCGTGRVLLPMLRAGAEVCGLDSSRPMLSVCVEKLAREPEAIRERAHLMLADMRDFELARHFNLAVIPFRGFQHLVETDDQLAALACIRDHLVGDGRLVLDLFNPSLSIFAEDSHEEISDQEPDFDMPDGRHVARAFQVHRRDFGEQVMDVDIIYKVSHPDGREERLVQSFPMRWLYRFEAEHLLARSGFKVEAVFEDHGGTPFSGKDGGELVLMARKI
jgi:SAM-dependent methyltransferase